VLVKKTLSRGFVLSRSRPTFHLVTLRHEPGLGSRWTCRESGSILLCVCVDHYHHDASGDVIRTSAVDCDSRSADHRRLSQRHLQHRRRRRRQQVQWEEYAVARVEWRGWPWFLVRFTGQYSTVSPPSIAMPPAGLFFTDVTFFNVALLIR